MSRVESLQTALSVPRPCFGIEFKMTQASKQSAMVLPVGAAGDLDYASVLDESKDEVKMQHNHGLNECFFQAAKG